MSAIDNQIARPGAVRHLRFLEPAIDELAKALGLLQATGGVSRDLLGSEDLELVAIDGRGL